MPATLTRVRPPGPAALLLQARSSAVGIVKPGCNDGDHSRSPSALVSPLTSYFWRQQHPEPPHDHGHRSDSFGQAQLTAIPLLPPPPSLAGRVKDVHMATTDSPSHVLPDGPPMSTADVIAFVRKELDEDEKRHGQAAMSPDTGSAPRTGFTLDLHRKNIDALPAEVVMMIKDKVERIALSHNARCTLPAELVLCDRLRYLNLKSNKLQHFPDIILGLDKLEILDIRYNDIEHIPQDIDRLTSLKYLALAQNRIKRLPMNLSEMSNLARLNIDGNPVEYPPAEILQLPADNKLLTSESEKEKSLCIQVKKYMQSASFRAKMKSGSEEDLSESNAETPRPPRRGVLGGRFPVRPSIGSIDFTPELPQGLSDSPPTNDVPPPIPMRSHARGVSSGMSTNRRVTNGVPRADGRESTRNRSETTTSSESIRSRRHGMVPRKNSQLGSVDEMSARETARASQASTIKALHSRAPSTASLANSLGFGAGDTSSSGAGSPIDTGSATVSASLSSLPEAPVPAPANSLRASRRVLFMLRYLHTPISDIVRQIRTQTPKRSVLERTLFSAKALADELDRLIHAGSSTVEDESEIDNHLLVMITKTAISSLHQYGKVAREVQRTQQSTVRILDSFHVRCLMNIAFTTASECRNVCQLLGFHTEVRPAKQDATPRVSQAWPHRADHATQRSIPGGRSKANGPPRSLRTSRHHIIPAPLSATSSMGMRPTLATPRSTESFASLNANGTTSSRSNTMRSMVSLSEGEEIVEGMYLCLKKCCELANSTLPPVRADLLSREASAKHEGRPIDSNTYLSSIHKCDIAIATCRKILTEMRRVGSSRMQNESLVQMCEQFTKDWAFFASEVMKLSALHIDISDLKTNLKPVQQAAKAAIRAAQDIPIDASGNAPKYAAVPGPPLPPLPRSYSYASNVTTPNQSVPATPLGAALGHAASAVLPASSNLSMYGYEPSYPVQTRGRMPSMHDRNDTVMQPTIGYGRR